MRFQRNVTLLLGQMKLVVVELDVGAKLDAKVIGGRWCS
jgi:hypothetical protein